MYSFGTKMASFVQFLANFGTKTYKNCTKNGIFLLYLWILIAFIGINMYISFLLGIYLVNFMVVWCVYLHKLPPNLCIQCCVYNIKYSILYTIWWILYGLNRFHYVWNKGLCSFSCQNLANYTKISPLM